MSSVAWLAPAAQIRVAGYNSDDDEAQDYEDEDAEHDPLYGLWSFVIRGGGGGDEGACRDDAGVDALIHFFSFFLYFST